jgi:hypothetical protein
VPSYTAWWLRHNALLDGRPPASYALAADLEGLYDPLDTSLDETFLAAIGVRTSLAALVAEPAGADDLLDRLGDASRHVDDDALTRTYVALAGLDPHAVRAPDRVRVRATVIVETTRATVLDSPAHLQLSWPDPPIVVPLGAAEPLAEVLDVDTTTTRLGAVNISGGDEQPVPDVVRRVLPTGPATWREHDDLQVAGQHVEWWVDADGRVHASTVHGLARGLAWAAGRWGHRLLLAEVLANPDRLDELLAEARLQGQ